MRRKKALTHLIGFVLLGVFLFGITFRQDWRPKLGLDLQGGVSVVLSPQGEVDEERISQSIAIMNQRINALGVSEPDIHRQGDTVVVQLAGVGDSDQAIQLVKKVAQLRFRPVLSVLPPDSPAEANPGTTVPGTVPGSVPPGSVPAPSPANQTASTTPTAATTPTTATPAISPSTTSGGSGPVSAGLPEGEGAAGAVGAQTPVTVTDNPTVPTAPVAPTAPVVAGAPTPVPAGATGAPVPAGTTATTLDPAVQAQIQQQLAQQSGQQSAGPKTTTPADQDTDPTKTVVLPEIDPRTGQQTQRFELGPSTLNGSALEGASAAINSQTGQWEVHPKFKPGAEGIDAFNALAQTCKPPTPTCPTGQIAITLDGRVISAPRIQPDAKGPFTPFSADSITVSGNFTEDSAGQLALALKYGALPVTFKAEATQTVSATLGEDSLRAGLIAGLVGLILVAIYMMAFYRTLGLLAVVKLLIEGMYLWFVISWLGSSVGLAMTLAGVTGVIVSIGVSLDSNVVYYEHLREDIRNGRTVRSAVDKSFASAFSTILKADGASLLGAALLYWLAIGPVRGFAFFLGLSTLLDLVSSYFYMRPVVFLATSSKICRSKPGLFGLPHAVAEDAPVTRGRPSRTKPVSRPVHRKSTTKSAGPTSAETDLDGETDVSADLTEITDGAVEGADQATTGAN